MNASTLTSLLGGIGLFLLGMRMMTDGLKLAAGNALRSILQSWTRTNLRGLFAGMLITAIVQSSSAVTVATVGFVNAGLLTLAQAIWVVFGTNVGTTMTGWLVALVGVKLDVGALALPLLGIGMLLRLAAAANVRRAGIGEAIAGFGAFFLGVGVLQGAFSELAPSIGEWSPAAAGPGATLAFVGIGLLLTMLTQSSSAAIAITLTATAGGAVPLGLAAAAVIGTNIGTTSTALFASFGATSPAKRVATAHIVFNLATGAVALLLLPLLLAASSGFLSMWSSANNAPAVLAVFHTLFNLLGVLLMWPLAAKLVRMLSRRFVSTDEEIGRPKHLDANLISVPALALRGLVLELERMSAISFDLAARRLRGVAVEAETRELSEGLIRLGHAVRAFIGGLSAGPLPEDVGSALPDLLRASQHLEDVATESAQLGRPRRERPGGASAAHAMGASDSWTALREVVLTCLTGDDAELGDAQQLGRGLQLSYESLKTDLLRAGARGSLSVDAMEEDLLRARRLRRLAESALKARRRLAPWRQRVSSAAASRAHAVTAPPEAAATPPEDATASPEAAAAGPAAPAGSATQGSPAAPISSATAARRS